jgi:hypothetical protein
MNWRHETVKMGVPPGSRAQRRRLRRVQGLGPEACLKGTAQGARHRAQGKNIKRRLLLSLIRSPKSKARGHQEERPYPRSQSRQGVIREISGLDEIDQVWAVDSAVGNWIGIWIAR